MTTFVKLTAVNSLVCTCDIIPFISNGPVICPSIIRLLFQLCNHDTQVPACKATASMMAQKRNSDIDVILGCDWLQKNKADIMFSTDSLYVGCAQSDAQTYEWPIADDGDLSFTLLHPILYMLAPYLRFSMWFRSTCAQSTIWRMS